MVLLLVVAGALGGVLTSAIAAQRLARERTLAQQAAQEEIESIRRLPYESVGTVSGNPPGSVEPSRSIAVPGLQATVRTRIQYVSDPTPTSYATQANYKRVTVTVTRDRDSHELTREVTYVAPPPPRPTAASTTRP
jgi:hypothetical protein